MTTLHFSALQWTEMILVIISVVLQVVLLVSAIRLYRVKRTRPFAFILGACVCYVIPHVTWFGWDFIHGFLSPLRNPSRPSYSVPWWRFSVREIALIFFLLLMTLALRSFLREPKVITTPRV